MSKKPTNAEVTCKLVAALKRAVYYWEGMEAACELGDDEKDCLQLAREALALAQSKKSN